MTHIERKVWGLHLKKLMLISRLLFEIGPRAVINTNICHEHVLLPTRDLRLAEVTVTEPVRPSSTLPENDDVSRTFRKSVSTFPNLIRPSL